MNNGWIKIHRSMLEWEWYDDHNTFRLFLHLIMKANHEPRKWRGKLIDRGQCLTSLDSLSSETGLSMSSLRTSIKKLKSTGEITSKSTSKNTLIIVENYDKYQCKDNEDDKQINKPLDKRTTNERQTNDKPMTTNKNLRTKELKKDIKTFSSDSEEIRLSQLLVSEIRKNKPDIKTPNIQSWANQVDKMIRLDKRDPQAIANVIAWAQSDSFWQSNILSTSKLRKQFDTLEMQMKGRNSGKTQYKPSHQEDASKFDGHPGA